jgi:putative ABC transport system permease protein
VTVTSLLTVTGVYDDRLPTFWSRPTVQVSPATLGQIGLLEAGVIVYGVGDLMVTVAPGAEAIDGIADQVGWQLAEVWRDQVDPEQCPDGIVHVEDTAEPDACALLVRGADTAAQARAAAWVGRADAVRAVGLVAALLSLLVAGLVIANTFQVMIAGRTRTLALLRSVGATRAQVRASVMVEALATGLGAAVLGVATGWALIAVAIAAAARLYPAIPLPETVPLSPWVALGAVGVGTAATWMAALAPAQLATRVTPVEALRPVGAPTLAQPPAKVRLRWAAALACLGVAGVVWGMVLTNDDVTLFSDSRLQFFAGVGTGVVGGGLIALGVVLSAVFWAPHVTAAVARPIARIGGATRIAAGNLSRNPRRTAATVTSLLIGVTLVTGMIVTAACLEAALDRRIGVNTPVDLTVGRVRSEWRSAEESDFASLNAEDAELADAELPAELVSRVEQIDGVAAAAVLGSTWLAVSDGAGETEYYRIAVADAAAVLEASNIPDLALAMRPGTILVSGWMGQAILELGGDTRRQGGAGGDVTTLTAWAEGASPQDVEFVRVDTLDTMDVGMIADVATLRQLGGEAAPAAIWVRVAGGADPVRVQDEILDAADAAPGEEPYPVFGEAVQRAQRHKAVDTVLLIGLALLAVSVLVAVIGVSNTLTLSVIERRREIAILRALGLTRSRTRWMLAVEGAVIAGVAGLAGTALGIGFAFVAADLVLGPAQEYFGAIPWVRVGAVFAVTIVTGFLASVIPGRRAARTPPSQALAAL